MKPTTKLIIQARLGSSRLPQKILLPFYKNEPILMILLQKLILKFGANSVIVATSTSEEDDLIIDLCNELNCQVYRGDENNVLRRYISAATFYNVEKIIRICSDNPFLDLEYLEKMIEFHEQTDYDYLAYELKTNLPTIKTHIGLFAEATSINALKKIAQLTSDKLYLEHVTNFLYTNPELFKIKLLPLPTFISGKMDIRLTVDTQEDFDICKYIYKKVTICNSNIQSLIEYIKSDEEIKTRMKKQIEENGK